ncbi:MAG: hypothetical protein ACYDDO_14945 [Acidiferrobacterales bacterium]
MIAGTLIAKTALKRYDFAADSSCLDDFWATETLFNTALLAYNLMRLIRKTVLRTRTLQSDGKDVQHTEDPSL